MKLKRQVFFLLTVTVIFLFLSYSKCAFASEISSVTTNYTFYDELNEKQLLTINKEAPLFNIENDTANVTLVYKRSVSPIDTNYSKNPSISNRTYPATGETNDNYLMNYWGVFLLLLLSMLLFYKRKMKLFLIIIVSLVPFYDWSLSEAAETGLPQTRLDKLTKNTSYNIPYLLDDFGYVGYIYEDGVVHPFEISGSVTIQYQDTQGNKIADSIIKSGNIGESYTSEQLDIEGYTLEEVIGKATGIFSEQDQTIIYIYTKNPVVGANVTIQYQDKQGNKIADSIIKSGNIGETYTSEELSIEGYTFEEVIGKATGIFSEQNQTVIYVYTKNPVIKGKVTIQYQDRDRQGNKIADDRIKSGNIGESYTSEQLDIEGYTFEEVIGSVTGIFSEQDQTIIYIYTKNPVVGANVTIQYQDKQGNKIVDSVIKSGNIGETYTSEELSIEGYTFEEVIGNATGIFSEHDQTVIYVYTKNPVAGGNVTIQYQDTQGNKITDSIIKSGNIGETYTSKELSIEGYTFEEVIGNATGIFSEHDQTVIYIYTKNELITIITVKSIDQYGNKIIDDIVISGIVGSEYKLIPENIRGYQYIECIGIAEGVFQKYPTEVLFRYYRTGI